MIKKLSLGVLLFVISFAAQAAVENWYTYWTFGFSGNKYPGEMNSSMNALEDVGGDRSQTSLEMLGFYIPNTDTSLLGLIISGTGDLVDFPGEGSIQVNTYLYSLSYMKFMGTEPGVGFYFRGDLGAARAVIIVDPVDGKKVSGESDWGAGVLGGIGYGFKVSEESRLLLGFNSTVKSIEDETYQAFMFTIGGLW